MKAKNKKPDLELLRRRNPGDAVGVIDIGSNSVRFVAYDMSFRPPLPFYNEKETCGLGEKLESHGTLSGKGRKSALKALKIFLQNAQTLNVETIITIATAAIRDAKDGAAFTAELKSKTGLDIRVITGEEEALYSARGVISAFPEGAGVIADLGGGSLELAQIDKGRIINPVSLQLGVLRLSAHEKDAGSFFNRKLDEAATGLAARTLYAVGGTWRAFAEAYQVSEGISLPHSHGYKMAAAQVKDFTAAIQDERPSDLIKFFGVEKKRAKLLPFAALALQELLEKTGAQTVIFSNAGLRDGVACEHMEKSGV